MPRRTQQAADQETDTHVNGVPEEGPVRAPSLSEQTEPDGEGHETAELPAETALVPVVDAPLAIAPGPELKADPGLYGVLGLEPSVSDTQIQTTYRQLASRLLGHGSNEIQGLKQLNVAYEVLGNPVRRAEYDRLRLSQNLAPGAPTPIRAGAKATARVTRRRRPRQAVQPRYAGLGDVLVVLVVVGLAALAGVLLIPRLSINLSALNALQSVLPLSNSSSSRRVIDATVTPAPTATPLPSVTARFQGSSVSVSNPTPTQNTTENVVIKLVRDGRPATGVDVWSTVQYRTTEERWPATGAVRTDGSGMATISFNIGGTTPNYPVTVHVFTQVEDQQLSWSTTFTPH